MVPIVLGSGLLAASSPSNRQHQAHLVVPLLVPPPGKHRTASGVVGLWRDFGTKSTVWTGSQIAQVPKIAAFLRNCGDAVQVRTLEGPPVQLVQSRPVTSRQRICTEHGRGSY
jgi:hypothetical protein